MDVPLVVPSNLVDRVWEHGLSYFGSARTLLDKVTKGSDSEWSIQNGNLQVIQTGMVTTRQGIVLAADSGLVGSPERERAAKDGTSEKGSGKKSTASSPAATKSSGLNASGGTPVVTAQQGQSPGSNTTDSKSGNKVKASDPAKGVDGWRVKTLLMPMLNPGDRVKLESRTINGVFRIQELKHTGDNWEGDWQTEMKLIDPAAPISDNSGSKKSSGGVAQRGGHRMLSEDDLELEDQ